MSFSSRELALTALTVTGIAISASALLFWYVQQHRSSSEPDAGEQFYYASDLSDLPSSTRLAAHYFPPKLIRLCHANIIRDGVLHQQTTGEFWLEVTDCHCRFHRRRSWTSKEELFLQRVQGSWLYLSNNTNIPSYAPTG